MKQPSFSVLVVEDEPTTLVVIAQLLEGLGFPDVDLARDGSEALSMLEAVNYDLLVADWHMKPLGGLELLRRFRSNPRFNAVPFIMTSADPSPDREVAALESGADAFLRKPFSVDQLRQTLDRILQRDPAEVRTYLGVELDRSAGPH